MCLSRMATIIKAKMMAENNLLTEDKATEIYRNTKNDLGFIFNEQLFEDGSLELFHIGSFLAGKESTLSRKNKICNNNEPVPIIDSIKKISRFEALCLAILAEEENRLNIQTAKNIYCAIDNINNIIISNEKLLFHKKNFS